jgi:hypothetical protein
MLITGVLIPLSLKNSVTLSWEAENTGPLPLVENLLDLSVYLELQGGFLGAHFLKFLRL